jgi:hypothetical protein
MTKAEQEREIELMSAIVEDYRLLAGTDEPQQVEMFVETRSIHNQGRKP